MRNFYSHAAVVVVLISSPPILIAQMPGKSKPKTPIGAVPKGKDTTSGPVGPIAAGPFGKREVSITSGGVTRWYTYTAPVNTKAKLGIVVAFHGGGGGMENMYAERQDLVELASAEQMIAVFPNGQNTSTNKGRSAWKAVHCCGPLVTTGASDVVFTQDIIKDLRRMYSIDTARVHAVGFSNGAMLVHKIAAEVPNLFASVAIFSGTVGGWADSASARAKIQPSGRVPILMLHGMRDDVVPFRGGYSASDAGRRDISFDESVTTWVMRNGCNATPQVHTEQGTTGRPLRIQSFTGCRGGADVLAIAIPDHVHHWPEPMHGGVDGTKKAMEFFRAHPRR